MEANRPVSLLRARSILEQRIKCLEGFIYVFSMPKKNVAGLNSLNSLILTYPTHQPINRERLWGMNPRWILPTVRSATLFHASKSADSSGVVRTCQVLISTYTIKSLWSPRNVLIFLGKHRFFSLKLTFNSSVIQSRHCAILARNCRLLMEYLHRCTEARFQSPSLLCSNGTLFI